MAIKSKELAHLLGVSTATMSLVLNNKPGISDDLRKSLTQRICELGYEYMLKEPAEILPCVPEGKRKSLAYVIISNCELSESDSCGFFPPVLEAAEKEARDNGYNLLVLHINYDEGCTVAGCINEEEVEGMIVLCLGMEKRIYEDLEKKGIPYVTIDEYDPQRRASSVTVNNVQAMETMIRYLKAMGHKKIGYAGNNVLSRGFIERREAYIHALKVNGLEYNKEYDLFIDGCCECDFSNMKVNWKNGKDMPTVFIGENDMLAWRLMNELKARGFLVPGDISVVGFDDRNFCTMIEPPLTTLRVPRQLLGRTLVFLLINKIRLAEKKLEDAPMKLELAVELVERKSVKFLSDH